MSSGNFSGFYYLNWIAFKQTISFCYTSFCRCFSDLPGKNYPNYRSYSCLLGNCFGSINLPLYWWSVLQMSTCLSFLTHHLRHLPIFNDLSSPYCCCYLALIRIRNSFLALFQMSTEGTLLPNQIPLVGSVTYLALSQSSTTYSRFCCYLVWSLLEEMELCGSTSTSFAYS